MRSLPARFFVLAVAAALLGAPALAAEQAGVSAAVRGQVALTRAQVAVGRQVVSGEDIFLEDAIKSGVRSGMQILLLDETVFTIGPESELVVDEFVYDPNTSAGKLSARVTKGVFRFVSGKIAKEKPSNMNVALPSGNLGVRGTMAAGRSNDVTKQSLLVLLGEGPENDTGDQAGAFQVCNAGSCVDVHRAGFGTRIDGPDSPPTPPFRVPQDQLDALTRAVSDPQGWVETALASGGGLPDVAAGPEALSDIDTRSATVVSGRDVTSGLLASATSLEKLDSISDLEGATVLVSQFTPQEVVTPLGVGTVPDGNTSFDDLGNLASQGVQTAAYQKAGLALSDGGSYDFSLFVDLGQRVAQLEALNIFSPSFGLQGDTARVAPVAFSSGAAPASFSGTADIQDVATATLGAQLVNRGGQIAGAAIPSIEIGPLGGGTGPPPVVNADPNVEIPGTFTP